MLLRRLILFLVAVPAFAAAVIAQVPQTSGTNSDPGQSRPGIRRLKRDHRLLRRQRLLELRSALNLTEEQRQQRRTIIQRHLEATKAQREQLFLMREKRRAGTLTPEDRDKIKTLRQELRASMQGTRGETSAILTPEQRTQLETLKNQRKQRREEMMKRRQEFLRNKQP